MPAEFDAPAGWAQLVSAQGLQRLTELEVELQNGVDSSAAGMRLRREGVDADEVSALLTQARLRARGRAKFGERASRMLFTQAGLEQASRQQVSRVHAQRFVDAGCMRVADLGCGIGSESIAFQDAGLTPYPVELDAFTAQIAEHNLGMSVKVADAETVSLEHVDGAFLDPARRTAGHSDTRRLRSTLDYSPSLEFAFSLAARLPLGIKLGPAFDREHIPAEAEAQWISVDGDLVEMALWFGRAARTEVRRSALVFTGDSAHELTAPADAADAEVGDLGAYLYEPDSAVIRARLIGMLAESIGATHLSENIAYLSSDQLVSTPFARAFRVIEELPVREKELRAALRQRDIGSLEIKKRGADVDPAALRKRLRLSGPQTGTLILTRVRGKHVALLAERCDVSAPQAGTA